MTSRPGWQGGASEDRGHCGGCGAAWVGRLHLQPGGGGCFPHFVGVLPLTPTKFSNMYREMSRSPKDYLA